MQAQNGQGGTPGPSAADMCAAPEADEAPAARG